MRLSSVLPKTCVRCNRASYSLAVALQPFNSPRRRLVHVQPEPHRKQLKQEAKKRRIELRQSSPSRQSKNVAEGWRLTVGLEIHAELDTTRKLFSTAPASVEAEPNAHVALFDLAYPGAQPAFQHATLVPALRAALALNCEVQRKSSFDRKHYFYQDQPAGYQITQYYG
jgi:aspartyl-tRNA(Asn)/glutamyl-tRNA(Gln) amidotransferase subunit B